SIAVFSKDIKDEIFSLTSVETLDVGRGAEAVIVTAPRNANTARIRGVELNLQQALAFLPGALSGLGVAANATFLDTEFTFLTTAGPRETGLYLQPDATANATVYYQRGRFEGRVSWNYIGGFLETINDTIPNADQYWKERSTFDANLSFRMTPRLTLYAEGQNLSNAGRRELTGPGRTYLQESAEYGRTFWAGVTASF
ncbi:TonB-dependent receptor domain-containing protein, partial [Sphingomonas sp. DT-51]|uniref:TonB-dependent receptor domain-containing protein n=1 Tax=Sphingomonas sp. DT-51 TaxID=3396165 RepID=UPI003F1BBF77